MFGMVWETGVRDTGGQNQCLHRQRLQRGWLNKMANPSPQHTWSRMLSHSKRRHALQDRNKHKYFQPRYFTHSACLPSGFAAFFSSEKCCCCSKEKTSGIVFPPSPFLSAKPDISGL